MAFRLVMPQRIHDGSHRGVTPCCEQQDSSRGTLRLHCFVFPPLTIRNRRSGGFSTNRGIGCPALRYIGSSARSGSSSSRVLSWLGASSDASPWFYVDRAVGGDRDHRGPD